MNTTAITDLICAVFIVIMFARTFSSRNLSKSNRLLNLCMGLMIVSLLADAGAYIIVGPEYPLALRYFLNLISFTASCVNLLAFIYYLEALFYENSEAHPWVFRGLKILEYFLLLCSVYEYIAGHLVSYDAGGTEVVNFAYPPYIVVLNMGILVFLLAITWAYRRKIGKKMAALLMLFNIVPIINSLLYSVAGIDFAFALSAISLVLVAEFVQKKQTQQRKLEQAATQELANQQRYMKTFGDMVNAALWTIRIDDSDEIVRVFWSDEVRRMLGFAETAEEFPNVIESWTDIIHPEDKERVLEHFSESLKSRDTSNFVYDTEYRMMRKNGEYRWYHTVGRMEYVEDSFRSLFGIVYDITAERQLKEQQALSDGLAREYHTVWMIDGTGDHMLHLYRSTGESTIQGAIQIGLNQSCFDLAVVEYIRENVLDEDQERVIEETRFATIERETPETGTYVVSYRRYTADRTDYTYHQMCFARAAGADGTCNYILAYRDADQMMREQIAQQKQLQDALNAVKIEAQRNDMLYEIAGASNWSYEISEDGKVTSAYYGKKAKDQIINNPGGDPMEWVDYLHPDDREHAIREFLAAAGDLTGNTPYETNYRIRFADGKYRWVKSSGRVLRHENGTAELFGMSIDITEQMEKEYEQKKQLEEALSLAEVANKAKSDFLFNMSHDIRTPMNAIIGFTNIAKREINNPEKASDCLEKVSLSSDILLNLINDVLDMSRIESGKAELHEEKYEIKEAFDTFEPAMAGLAASKDIDLKFTIGEVRDQFVFADGPRFDRVLINIISNAIKYTPAEGFVKVSAEQIADTKPGYGNYRFTVADSGIGMSEEFQEHMFEDFTREENSTTSGVQGTGLGLSLAKKLVDMMGGTISCKSKQGVGTTFTIDFPFRLQTESDIMEKSTVVQNETDIDLHGRRALLVEDNELNREIAEEILSGEGIIVETAVDGQKAVNKARERGAAYYDFILMDIQMPVMNGYEAAKTMHKLIPDLKSPIIALSANAFEEDRKKSIAAGMDDHVAKPINVKELIGVLSKFL